VITNLTNQWASFYPQLIPIRLKYNGCGDAIAVWDRRPQYSEEAVAFNGDVDLAEDGRDDVPSAA
jgi:hypothetical protein